MTQQHRNRIGWIGAGVAILIGTTVWFFSRRNKLTEADIQRMRVQMDEIDASAERPRATPRPPLRRDPDRSVRLLGSDVRQGIGDGYSLILRDALIVPRTFVVNDEAVGAGYQIERLEPSTLLETMGLQKDDVLLRVGDNPLNEDDDGLALYDTLLARKDFPLLVERDGAEFIVHIIFEPE